MQFLFIYVQLFYPALLGIYDYIIDIYITINHRSIMRTKDATHPQTDNSRTFHLRGLKNCHANENRLIISRLESVVSAGMATIIYQRVQLRHKHRVDGRFAPSSSSSSEASRLESNEGVDGRAQDECSSWFKCAFDRRFWSTTQITEGNFVMIYFWKFAYACFRTGKFSM